ncbi:hypothetical protein ACSFBI_25995 [Variovorax sp. RB3P1]|jgi:hypothetical protein|uniref:hypothetical protein n=1 Tax=Variovorax sp. RB3P1 TaxID=3443732 RepID=UPI003F48F4B1
MSYAQQKLWHSWTFEPEWRQWQVQCFDNHGRPSSRPVWVGAANAQRAVAAGKYWMRLVGIKRRGNVVAKPWDALNDPAMRGYVVRGDIAKANGSAA